MSNEYQPLVCQQVPTGCAIFPVSEIEICITPLTSDNPSGDEPLPLSTPQGANCLSQAVSIPTVVTVRYSAQTSALNHRSDRDKFIKHQMGCKILD